MPELVPYIVSNMKDPIIVPSSSDPQRPHPTNSLSKRTCGALARMDSSHFTVPLETLPPELRVEVYEHLLPQHPIRLDDPACKSLS